MTIGVGIAIGGVALAGVAASGALAPGAPTPVNYGQVTRDAQQATIDLMPQRYAAEAQFDPQFAALQNTIAKQNLFGSPGGQPIISTTNVPGFKNSQTGEFRAGTTAPLWSPSASGTHAGAQQRQVDPWQQFTEQQQTSTPSPAAPGLLDIATQAQPALTALQTNANSQTRAADIADVKNLGPASLAAIKGFNPASTNLMNELEQSAQQGLDAGYSLLPAQQRAIQQNIRAAQAARGMGTGPSDALQESQALTLQGENLRQQRLATASGVVNQEQALYGDPFLQILGRTSGQTPTPGSVSNTYPSTVGTALDNIGGAPYNIAGYNATNANNARIAGYNSQMAGLGTLFGSGTGSTLQSLFGGITGLTSGPGLMGGNSSYF